MFHQLKQLPSVFRRTCLYGEYPCIWQMMHTAKLSFKPTDHFESFIDKEFAKAQEDLDTDTLDNPGALLQKFERDQRRRIQATNRARTARLFKPPRQPRSISWDTMEQIRYLKQEHGEEWTTANLAASFGLTEALVVKVLKSKFVPTEKRRCKQDEKAKVYAGLLAEKTTEATGHDAITGTSTQNKKPVVTALSKGSPTKTSKAAGSIPFTKFKLSTEKQGRDTRSFQKQSVTLSGRRSRKMLPSK